MKTKTYFPFLMLLLLMVAGGSAKAQTIIGYSGPFSFNTKFRITGTVICSETGMPIEGALVHTMFAYSTRTNEEGQYNLFVPPGFGYNVTAISTLYQPSIIQFINVTNINPVVQVNFELTPDEVEPVLTTINPNPNPQISVIQKGGVLSRHYRVINNYGGGPLFDIPVTVTSDNGFEMHYLSNEEGFVHIVIPSSEVGNGAPGAEQLFSITAVNFEVLEQPIEFLCQVIPRRFEKYWDSNTFTKLGAYVFAKEIESGVNGTLRIENGYSPATFQIDRQHRSGGGVTPGVGAGLVIQMGEITSGFSGGFGYELIFSGVTEDNYLFSEDFDHHGAMAQYLLLASGSFGKLDATLRQLFMACQVGFVHWTAFENAIIGESKGLDKARSANISANIGINIPFLVEASASGNIGFTGRSYYVKRVDKLKNELLDGVELAGEVAVSSEAGIHFAWEKDRPWANEMHVVDNELERIGLKFEVIKDQNNDENVLGFRFYLMERNTKNNSGEELIFCYEFTGSSVVENIGDINDITRNLKKAGNSTATFLMHNSAIESTAMEVFDKIYEMQSASMEGVDVSYFVLKRVIDDEITSTPLSVYAGLVSLSANYGNSIGTEEGRQRIVAQGKWILGKHLPLVSYPESMPSIGYSLQDKLQQIISAIPETVYSSFSEVTVIPKSNIKNQFFLGSSGSFLEITDQDFPLDHDTIKVFSWGWYGNSPSIKPQDLDQDMRTNFEYFRNIAEKNNGMTFGIGGFYQFEPFNVELNGPALLSIKYSADELTGVDENTLGIYSEDKENKKWVFIGGEIDLENQTVTVPISQLGLYTLAPAMPYKEFLLTATPDTIEANGISTTLVISDTIFNNDHTPVINGELFSITVSDGGVITPDADPETDGVQVEAQNHRIEFAIKSGDFAGPMIISARSLRGSATGVVEVYCFEQNPPETPVLISTLPGNNAVRLNWESNTEPDLGGYKIYYDTDTIPPYEGIHTILGGPSPISLGIDTTWRIGGLMNDTTYYFFLSAYDISGNESPLSGYLTATPVSHFLIDLSVYPEGAGTVDGEGEYIPWQTVSIAATENEGWHFLNWTENGTSVSDENPLQFSIFSNRNLTANFSSTVSVPEIIESKGRIKVYPNPAQTNIWIEFFNDGNKRVNIQLVNLHGQVVGQKTIDEQGEVLTNFNSAALKPGVYLLTIQGDKWSETKKVVIRP